MVLFLKNEEETMSHQPKELTTIDVYEPDNTFAKQELFSN